MPQGSVSGPIAFLVLINDLPERIRAAGAVPQLLADDIEIHGEALGSSGDKQLQRALDVVLDWCYDWGMQLNLRKTVTMLFTNQRKIWTDPPIFRLGGATLEMVRSYRYLGIWFTPKLKWNLHVAKVVDKARRSANIIRSTINRHGPPPWSCGHSYWQ